MREGVVEEEGSTLVAGCDLDSNESSESTVSFEYVSFNEDSFGVVLYYDQSLFKETSLLKKETVFEEDSLGRINGSEWVEVEFVISEVAPSDSNIGSYTLESENSSSRFVL